MKFLKEFLYKNKHFFTLNIFLFLTLWFLYLKKSIIPKHIMYIFIDSKIPFIKEFVLAYYFWFVYMSLAFIYLGIKSKEDFYKLEIFLSVSMILSYIIFIIYPNAQFPRPNITDNDVFSYLVNFIYCHDGTNNVFPSIHVCNSIGVHLVLYNSNRTNNKIKALSFITMILICASTLFIKQHSVIDVLGGIILSGLIYSILYIIPKILSFYPISERLQDK